MVALKMVALKFVICNSACTNQDIFKFVFNFCVK